MQTILHRQLLDARISNYIWRGKDWKPNVPSDAQLCAMPSNDEAEQTIAKCAEDRELALGRMKDIFSNGTAYEKAKLFIFLIRFRNQYSEETKTLNAIGAFRELELNEEDLSCADMSDIDLADAKMYRTNLSHANLMNTNLQGAYMKQAILVGANLENADLYRAYMYLVCLVDANLKGANLERAFLVKANVNHAKFTDSNMHKTCLDYVKHMRIQDRLAHWFD